MIRPPLSLLEETGAPILAIGWSAQIASAEGKGKGGAEGQGGAAP